MQSNMLIFGCWFLFFIILINSIYPIIIYFRNKFRTNLLDQIFRINEMKVADHFQLIKVAKTLLKLCDNLLSPIIHFFWIIATEYKYTFQKTRVDNCSILRSYVGRHLLRNGGGGGRLCTARRSNANDRQFARNKKHHQTILS